MRFLRENLLCICLLGALSQGYASALTPFGYENSPTAGDDEVTTAEDTPITFSVVSNDSDEDTSLDPATVDLDPSSAEHDASIAIPGKGTFTVAGGSVTFTPDADYVGGVSIQYTVADTDGEVSNPATIKVTVTAVNDAPEITGQHALSVGEDQSITLQLADLTVKDPDNNYPADFLLTVSAGANYTVSGHTVTPNPDFTGTLSVPVHVSDGAASSGTVNVSITVQPVNDPPAIIGQIPLTMNEDATITLVLANLTVKDPDNTSGFTFTVLPGTGYSFSGNTVTPAADYAGPLTVLVKVNDGAADSDPYGVAITVNPVNDAPRIDSQAGPLTTGEEQPLTLTLQDFVVIDPDDAYPDDFTLSVSPGSNYSVSGMTITPAANYTGSLTVPVRVSDGTTSSAAFDATVTVTAVNDPPKITGQQALTVAEDNAITLQLSNFTVTDVDNPGYPAGFTLTVAQGNNYTFSGRTITPNPDYSGTLTVHVTVSDGESNSDPFDVTITVTPVNDAPRITGQQPLSTGQRQPITLSLSQLFVLDPDDTYPGDFSLFVLSGSNYSVSGTTVTPAASFSGQLLVKVLVNDGTANSDTYNLQILVNSVNDPPQITGQQPLSTNEDTPITLVPTNLLVNDSDNNYPTGFTITILPGTNYTASGLTITPASNYSGTLSVGIKVNDGLSDSAPFNLQVTVNPVNDAPTITGQQTLTAKEDTPMPIQLSNLVVVDPDNAYPNGFTLTVLNGANYTVSGNTITPALNYFGQLTVGVRVNDGNANSNDFNLQVGVDAVNDAPKITGQVTLSTGEDVPITIRLADLTVEDPDNNYPNGFSLAVQAGTNYTFSGRTVTPALNFNGTLAVNVTVSDGAATSAVFPLKIDVSPINTAPIITGQKTLATNEETPLTINLSDLTVNDPDDAYPGAFTLTVGQGTNYTVTGNIVTPALNYNGNLTVPVTVNDGVNNSKPFNLIVKVNPINDPPGFDPIGNQQQSESAQQKTYTITLNNVTKGPQENTQTLTFYVTSGNLDVIPNPTIVYDGTSSTAQLKYTVLANKSGTVTINILVFDNGSGDEPNRNSFQTSFQVAVVEVNNAPTLNAITFGPIQEDAPMQSIPLTGISAGAGEDTQTITVTATHNKPEILEPAVIEYTSPNTAGVLKLTPKPNANGTVQVTVTVTDSGPGSPAPSVNTLSRQFNLVVQSINDLPEFISQPVVQAAAGELYTYEITAVDVDNTNFTLTAVQKPDWLSFTMQAVDHSNPNVRKATLTGIPGSHVGGNFTVSLQAKDAGTPVLQNFTINVNSRPTVTAFDVSTKEDTPVALEQQQFLTAYTDVDGNSLAGIRITDLPDPRMGQLRLKNEVVAKDAEIPVASIGDLRYLPAANAFGTDSSLHFTATDGLAYATKSARINVTITPVNDAPILTLESQDDFLIYQIGSGPHLLSEDFQAEDPDYDSLVNAEVGFRAQNYESNIDQLLFTDTEHIKGTFNAQSGALTLTGKASVSEYTTFIKGIRYNYTSPGLPEDTVKIVYVTVSDGKLLSDTRDRFIHLRYTFKDVAITGGFTPNGDNINETWVPIDRARTVEFADSELKIYDRRGRLLFETVGFEKEWDGRYNGELLPPESYFFTLDLKLPFLKKTYKGVVTILR